MRVHLDVESKSAADIWDCGAWVYAAHHSTEVLCLAFAVDDEPITLIPYETLIKETTPGRFHSLEMTRLGALAKNPNAIFVAHNAFFEESIWKNIMEKKFGMHPIPIRRWRDTMAKANALALPASLDKASRALGLPIEKDMKGRQIMKKLSTPRKAKEGEDPDILHWNTDPEDFQRLYEYCIKDVEVERMLDKRLPELNAQEQEIWFIDQEINMRGVQADMDLVRSALKLLTLHTARLNTELSELTGGVVSKGTEVLGMVRYLQGRGVKIDDLQKETVANAIKSGALDDHAIKVLRYRQELGKSSNAKYEKLIRAADEKGVVRDCFVYHSASTGRWGGKLVQLQNLPANRINADIKDAVEHIKTFDYATLLMLYGRDLSEVVSVCLRGVFLPRPGRVLNVVDYSAVEARGVFWLAGETAGLQEFRESDAGRAEEIYVRMAQRIFQNPKITKKDKDERNLGKTTILGCGYQMGAKRFVDTCASWGVKLPANLYSADGDSWRAVPVDMYRRTYPAVPTFWYSLQRTAIEAVSVPGRVTVCGKISWVYNRKQDFLFCKLPSGRFLAYREPRLEEGMYGPSMTYMTLVNAQWVREHTYGGRLAENCTQAVCRDLMAWSMPKLEKAGLPIVMHTHDEVVCEDMTGGKRLKEMIDIMCGLPAWAEGFPIKAEGFSTERYMKQ